MKQKVEKPKISIFDFDNYRDFLLKVGMPNGLYSHSSNNLQTWSKRLGYKSSSSLTMVLKGQRLPSSEMQVAISEDLKMSIKEKNYFSLLIQLEKCNKKNKDPEKILEKISKLNSDKQVIPFGINQFSTISEWYFLAIKQLISTSSFVEDIEWIYRRLRKKVTPSQIKTALGIMLETQVIGRDFNGELVVLKEGLITTNNVPSSAIRRHHYGMINRALEAIDEQDVTERQISSVTMKIKEEDLESAKECIFEFIKDFNNKFSCSEAEELFQMNMQFFKHTKEIKKQ
jgi:uncharacterized protein (TIGR02147 family)